MKVQATFKEPCAPCAVIRNALLQILCNSAAIFMATLATVAPVAILVILTN